MGYLTNVFRKDTISDFKTFVFIYKDDFQGVTSTKTQGVELYLQHRKKWLIG